MLPVLRFSFNNCHSVLGDATAADKKYNSDTKNTMSGNHICSEQYVSILPGLKSWNLHKDIGRSTLVLF